MPVFGPHPLRQLARAALQPQPRGHRQLPNPILDLIQLIDPSGGNRRVIPGPSRWAEADTNSIQLHNLIFRLIKTWPAKSPVAKSARPVHARVPYSQSASSKLRQHLTPITKRGVLPNFIFLDAEQMPGYEKFGKHEIVR